MSYYCCIHLQFWELHVNGLGKQFKSLAISFPVKFIWTAPKLISMWHGFKSRTPTGAVLEFPSCHSAHCVWAIETQISVASLTKHISLSACKSVLGLRSTSFFASTLQRAQEQMHSNASCYNFFAAHTVLIFHD